MSAFFGYWLDGMRLGWDAQQVIALRLAYFARNDARAPREAVLMVSEKMAALAEAQFATAAALASGRSAQATLHRAMAPYRRRVRANHKRLRR